MGLVLSPRLLLLSCSAIAYYYLLLLFCMLIGCLCWSRAYTGRCTVLYYFIIFVHYFCGSLPHILLFILCTGCTSLSGLGVGTTIVSMLPLCSWVLDELTALYYYFSTWGCYFHFACHCLLFDVLLGADHSYHVFMLHTTTPFY